MKLLRLPFLVQKRIFEDIDLFAVLSITMLSKKSYATVKACLRHDKYHLSYSENSSFRLERKFLEEDGNTLHLVLAGPNRSPLIEPYQLWRIGNQDVSIKSRSWESNETISTFNDVYCGNMTDFSMETLQYISKLLPKLSLTLCFGTPDVETFRRTMQSVESVEEIQAISVAGGRDPVPQDEFVKLVLDESQRTRRIELFNLISDNFNYLTSNSFKYESVFMLRAGWVSRDYFIKQFLSCKKVELDHTDYSDEDLTAIFKAWSEGSPLEFLKFDGTYYFHPNKPLYSVLAELPGVVPVRNAMLTNGVSTESRLHEFTAGYCYLIEHNDGQTRALVYHFNSSVMLSTEFQIGREVDEMAARIDQEHANFFDVFFGNVGAEEEN